MVQPTDREVDCLVNFSDVRAPRVAMSILVPQRYSAHRWTDCLHSSIGTTGPYIKSVTPS